MPDQLEAWLREIDKQQPTVDLDWRQRWAPTNVVATPAPAGGRSGVTVRIPAGSNTPFVTRGDRIRRRWARRLAGAVIALILLFGAIVAGPAAIAASLDIWSAIDEQLTAPAWPLPPPPAHHVVGAPPRLTLSPEDEPAAATTSRVR
jgi:hypothetical protein